MKSHGNTNLIRKIDIQKRNKGINIINILLYQIRRTNKSVRQEQRICKTIRRASKITTGIGLHLSVITLNLNELKFTINRYRLVKKIQQQQK